MAETAQLAAPLKCHAVVTGSWSGEFDHASSRPERRLRPMASLDQNLLSASRRATGLLRHNTRRVARIASRFNRAGAHVWDLIVWSRIDAARLGFVPLDLSEHLLARKGVPIGPPMLRVTTADDRLSYFEKGFAAVNAMLFANLQLPDSLSPHRYALPGPAFRGVYLWDSAFIAQIWRHWDRDVGLDILRSVVALREGDRLQHVVADFVQSAFTQPPLLGWSLVRLLKEMPRDEAQRIATEFYPPLAAYQSWLRGNRRLNCGLYAWRHPYESGIDNSPRFGSRDERRFEPTARVAAPDFSAYVVLQCEALAWLASLVGDDRAARAYEVEAEALRNGIDRLLWDEEQGLYHDRHDGAGEWKRTQTIASLLPLWCGAGENGRVDRLCERLRDPMAFGTPVPLPSVALCDPTFERDMWRGPVWINTAYAVVLGLRRHGRLREAAELAWRLCDAVYHVYECERQIYEFYDPVMHSTEALRRKQGNWWKRFTLGQGPQREFVGWTGLVNTMVIELLFGFQKEQGKRALCPAFPQEASGAVLNLRLPGEQLELEIAVESKDRIRGWVQGPHGVRGFTAGFGERIELDALLDRAPSANPAERAPAER